MVNFYLWCHNKVKPQLRHTQYTLIKTRDRSEKNGRKLSIPRAQARVSVQWPPTLHAKIGRQEVVDIWFLQGKSKALIPIPLSKNTYIVSCLKASPCLIHLCTLSTVPKILEGVNSCFLNQWIERSALPLSYSDLCEWLGENLDDIKIFPLPTRIVLGSQM